jgi:hypothetical protein
MCCGWEERNRAWKIANPHAQNLITERKSKNKAGSVVAARQRFKRLKKQGMAAQVVSRDSICCQKHGNLTLLPRRHYFRIFTHHLTGGRSVLCDLRNTT